MNEALRYGLDSSLALEVSNDTLSTFCHAPRGAPLANLDEAIDRALVEPLGFPPLAQAVVPGDKVVLALEAGVPQSAVFVARVIAALVAADVAAGDITLLVSEPGPSDRLARISPEFRSAIRTELHDPTHRESLSYLGADAEARPIYINRTMYDADLVISIGCLRVTDSLGYYGVGGGVFPAFSDAASIERYHSTRSARAAQHHRLRRQCDEVSWLLGARFTIQVVPGARDEVLSVLAGDSQAVDAQGHRLAEEAWSYSVPRRAAVVIATIEGGQSEQTWENVGRALAAVARVAESEGAAVLCTDLAEVPGPSIQQIIGAENLDDALCEIERSKASDALAAATLVEALRRGPVYLISRLDDEFVEEMGISPVAPGQLSRLAGRYDSCIVLTNAHRALARPRGESAAEPSLVPRKSRR